VICKVFQGFGAVSGYDLTGKAGIDRVQNPADVIDMDCSIKQSTLSEMPYMAFLIMWQIRFWGHGTCRVMYKRYGQPNDQLILLNVYNFRVKDVPVDPVYHEGEVSGIKIKKVIFTLGWLLVKRFFWRLKEKYIIRDFHPLVFFYAMGLSLGGMSLLLFIRVFYIWAASGTGNRSKGNCRSWPWTMPQSTRMAVLTPPWSG